MAHPVCDAETPDRNSNPVCASAPIATTETQSLTRPICIKCETPWGLFQAPNMHGPFVCNGPETVIAFLL